MDRNDDTAFEAWSSRPNLADDARRALLELEGMPTNLTTERKKAGEAAPEWSKAWGWKLLSEIERLRAESDRTEEERERIEKCRDLVRSLADEMNLNFAPCAD